MVATNEGIANVFDCAPENNLMICPMIQKSFVATCASKIIYNIVCDIGDDVYRVLIDESGDSVGKEQMEL